MKPEPYTRSGSDVQGLGIAALGAFPEPQPYVFDTSVQANCENKFTIISSECREGCVKRLCDIWKEGCVKRWKEGV